MMISTFFMGSPDRLENLLYDSKYVLLVPYDVN